MKVRNIIGAMAVVGLAAAPPAAWAQSATTPTQATKVDDGTLKSRIESRLKDTAALKDSDIDVAVENGVVTLTGTVQSAAQSQRARTVANVAGVSSVNNRLTVDSKAARTMDRTADKAEGAMNKAGNKAEKVLEKAGVRIEDDKNTARTSGTAGRQTGAQGKDDVIDVDANINDAWITTKIKANFVNEDALKGSDINVDTNSHVVTLKGTVASAAGRARAVELAKSTKGVKRVIDALTIAPAK